MRIPARLRQVLVGAAAAGVHGMRRLARRPQGYILVASHMRSGSSLLHHLLQTNPSILGAGESNRIYRNAADLRHFALWVHVERHSLLHWRDFVADQVNHTGKLPDIGLLRRADVKTVILIREPLGTIASLIRLMSDFYGSRWSESEVICYYIERIRALGSLAAALSAPPASPALLLTHEQLVKDSVAALAALQRHLGLAEPFATRYETFDFTGTRGDPAPKIRSKRIVPENGPSDYELPMAWREPVQELYREVMTSLRSTCVPVRADHRSDRARAGA